MSTTISRNIVLVVGATYLHHSPVDSLFFVSGSDFVEVSTGYNSSSKVCPTGSSYRFDKPLFPIELRNKGSVPVSLSVIFSLGENFDLSVFSVDGNSSGLTTSDRYVTTFVTPVSTEKFLISSASVNKKYFDVSFLTAQIVDSTTPPFNAVAGVNYQDSYPTASWVGMLFVGPTAAALGTPIFPTFSSCTRVLTAGFSEVINRAETVRIPTQSDVYFSLSHILFAEGRSTVQKRLIGTCDISVTNYLF